MQHLLAALEYHFEHILRRTALFVGRHLSIDMIVNPEAGTLSSEKRAVATVEHLNRLARGIAGRIRGDDEFSLCFHLTHYVGHAHEIATRLCARTVPDVHLIVSAGGDGTHGEVLSACDGPTWRAAAAKDLYFVRLPFGTGNDGADAPDLPAAVRLLLGSAEPRRTGQVVATPREMPAFRAFNIASVGLDAYVSYLTNRLKGRFGGDLYKLIADVMTLLYERVVGAGPMRIDIVDEQGQTDRLERVFLLVALGVSGYRRYGGGKLVLPAYENFCAIEPIGLLGKLRLKALFYRGEHVHEPNVVMRSVRKIVIHYGRAIPMQVDGETVWLGKENFPLEMQVGPPEVPVLVFAQSKV